MEEKQTQKTMRYSGPTEPARSTEGSAGYDIYVDGKIKLEPGVVSKINTKIRLEIPKGYYGRIETRSSYAVKGLFVQGGIIDSDYRGEISVLIYNSSETAWNIREGDKIAQIIFHKYQTFDMVRVNPLDLTKTKRGTGGFGSTGK